MNGPQIVWLPDGRRRHMNHGPIDLVVEAYGDDAEVELAYHQAAARFQTILDELVAELPELRRPSDRRPRTFAGSTACRMEAAASLFAPTFVTPMAAVAGAVADEMLAAMTAGRRLEKAYVNDGGDSALHIVPAGRLDVAIGGTGHGLADRISIQGSSRVRGVATSGWRGRSHSLGIADAVTVLARSAAIADVAATLIANDVDLPGHLAIARIPARRLAPDSDLGDRKVTTSVGVLCAQDVDEALARGAATAARYMEADLIEAAALFLNGRSHVVGTVQGFGSPEMRPPGETGRLVEETHG